MTVRVENDEPDDEGDTLDSDEEVTVRPDGMGPAWYNDTAGKVM